MKPRNLFTPLLTLGLLLLLASPHSPAQSAIRWQGKQLQVGMGSVVAAGDTLTIRANPSGQIFVSIDARGIQLDDLAVVGIEFGEVPAGAQTFIAWQTAAGKEGMRHFAPPAAGSGELAISMSGEANWTGAAGEIGLGILIPAGTTASVKSISLLPPTLFSAPLERLREWSAFRGWRASDINFYIGTSAVDQQHAPVPWFGQVLLAALLAYLAYLLVRGRLRQFDWGVAGALLLACWIALDLLWQARLGAQLADTRATFAGKSSDEKLLASGDALVVQFITEVKAALAGEAPRIFLASGNDYAAMLSAYYLAPVNTYWHRKGPELPDKRFLGSGDYILLVPPATTPYDAAAGIVTLPDTSQVPVEPLLQSRAGLLLRVI